MACRSDWPEDGPVLLLLLARGLEDVAIHVLHRCLESAQRPESAHLHSERCLETTATCPRRPEASVSYLWPPLASHRWTALSATQAEDADARWPCALPKAEEGEAFVGKVLLQLSGFASCQRRHVLRYLLHCGLFQGILAFLTAADDIQSQGARSGRGSETSFHGSLRQLEELVATSPRWAAARQLHREVLSLDGSSDERSTGKTRFRASCVRDGQHKGFRSQDAMAAMGAGAMVANEDLEIDLYGYELEVFGFLSGQLFACGLWLGEEWRVNPRGEIYGGAERNFHCVPVGDRRAYLPHDVRNLPRLRPSTALLMLNMAGPRPGELLLDPFGGVGTIAVEAACRFPALLCISSDKDPSACHTAAMHCQLAKKMGRLQPGSRLETRKWDARKLKLEDRSVDLIVSDLPFLNRCDFDFDSGRGTSARQGLAAVLRSFARVLKERNEGGPGLALLLVQSRHMLEDALRYSDNCLKLQDTGGVNPRPVVIGGAACWIFVLEQDRSLSGPAGAVKSQRPSGDRVFHRRQGVPPSTYICRCCHLPGHWRDRCPVLPRPRHEIERRATM